jgi:mono/diheme cytochrome c family protein
MNEQKPAAGSREQHEPGELHNPVPWWMLAIFLGLIAWGAWYYFQNVGFPSEAGDRRSAIVINPSAKVDGAAAFAGNCAACHQPTGLGLPGVFPPLAGSEWAQGEAKIPVQILLHGLGGPVTVKGATYQGAMPNFGKTLDDATLAAILTYIRRSWGNVAPEVDPALFSEQRKLDRSTPWTEYEIKATVGAP